MSNKNNSKMEEQTLVLIKPDAMLKGLAGCVITELHSLGLKMIGLKLVNVKKELAEQHYCEHKEKPFFEKLIKNITGNFTIKENVMQFVSKEEKLIKKQEK